MSAIAADDIRGCPSRLEPASDAPVADPTPFVKRTDDGQSRLDLSVFGAKCGGCISKIEGALNALPGVTLARLNLSTGKLVVEWKDATSRPIDIVRAVTEAGYRATPFDPVAQAADSDAEGRFLLRCLAVAGFAMANIMLLSVAVWSAQDGEMGPATQKLMHWISAMIALPAAAFAGRPFFRSAFNALKARHANMDVPISLAVILALGVSLFETTSHGGHTYFDAAVMLLFFLLIGRFLEHRLRSRARAAAQDLLALQATTANRMRSDGTLEVVASGDIVPGDRLVLWPGDRAPVNGDIVEGSSAFDISLVTGESAPVTKKEGDALFAGVVNQSNRILMRANATSDTSLVADLARLIEAGEQSKSGYIRIADRAASLYVPVVHSLALATFIGWLAVGAGGYTAITNAIAVLIITCPCALGLAAPAVQVVATGALFKRGILVKSGDALERLAKVDSIVFDKTGTLTHGRFQLTNRDEVDNETLRRAALLTRSSRHPLARAVTDIAGAGEVADDVRETPGCGIEAVLDGTRARFGRGEWLGIDHESGDDESEAWFQFGQQPPVRFVFSDQLRDDARGTIAALRQRGLSVEMLSGDRVGPARRIARAAGFDRWTAKLSPGDKMDRLAVLKKQGHVVAMVGDGLNDAPSLAGAHASLSPGNAADASQAAADFVYQGDGLAPIVAAYDVSKQARRRIIENFSFAALYNAIAIPLAVFGFVTPLIAALAMSGSSVIVTLNALRLRGSTEVETLR